MWASKQTTWNLIYSKIIHFLNYTKIKLISLSICSNEDHVIIEQLSV